MKALFALVFVIVNCREELKSKTLSKTLSKTRSFLNNSNLFISYETIFCEGCSSPDEIMTKTYQNTPKISIKNEIEVEREIDSAIKQEQLIQDPSLDDINYE